MNVLAALFQWLWAPIVAVGVSVLYFQSSRNERSGERVAVSLHGATLATLYFVALAVHSLGASRPSLGGLFWVLLLLPAALVVVALVSFKGNRTIHLLQLANLLSACWVFFVGTMAVTGNWL